MSSVPDLNLERLKTILDELSTASGELSAEHQKLADYYNSFMDLEAIEAGEPETLRAISDICHSAKTHPAAAIAALHSKFRVSALFHIHSSPDKSNSDHSLCSLYQSGLGLPDRDYYFDEDKADKRVKYIEYLVTIFSLLGSKFPEIFPQYVDKSDCEKAAAEVMAFETLLAESHMTRTASRDPLLTFNKMSVNGLIALTQQSVTWEQYLAKGVHATSFDWNAYFAAIGKPASELGDLNVASKSAIKFFPQLLSNPSLTHYLHFHAINTFASQVQSEFVDAHFNFYEREMKGTQEQLPRWKRALHGLEAALGEALGQLYVAKYFAGDAKQRALTVVESVRDALRERLLEVEWMSEETRREALVKMEKFKVKIGFPDQWLDYSTLHVVKGRHLSNVIASRRYDFALELSRMNVLTDKNRWFMTPQTVNAYYHPSLNEIVFPAAILQAPFFDATADLAVQYGSLGSVVGHEMTHGFDDEGRKYDSTGNLRDWWAEGDGAEYERRVAVMIRQAEQFEVHGTKLNGKLTCGENIADLGGVKLSLRALNKHLSTLSEPAPLINGFTPQQRLFLAWSQAWRENVKKERAIQMVTLDPHGPNELRCNGTLSNIKEFLEAFEITEGHPMYRAPEDRVDIW
eukprot:gene23830-30105_t